MEATPFLKRKKFVVDQRFQLQYLKIFIVTSVALVVIGAGLYYLTRYYGGAEPPELVGKILLWMSVFIILFCTLMGVLCVALTHRVAGAAWHLEQHLKRLQQGDYTGEIKLRKEDYLHSLADGLNSLSMRLKGHQRGWEETARALRQLKQTLEQEGRLSPAHRDLLVHVLENVERSARSIDNVSSS